MTKTVIPCPGREEKKIQGVGTLLSSGLGETEEESNLVLTNIHHPKGEVESDVCKLGGLRTF